MDKLVYGLCAITCAIAAILLLRGYLRSRMRLLLWSTICFFILTVANIMVYIDFIVFPSGDLSLVRNCVHFVGVSVLLFGMIWETV